MKSNNILLLQKRGCDFWNDEEAQSDISNYRVTTPAETIRGKDGNLYFLEFCLWRNKGHYRTTTKNGQRELKKPVFEIDAKNCLCIHTQYETKEGCFANISLEKRINKLNLPYTKQGILEAVNIISKNQYNKIKFI